MVRVNSKRVTQLSGLMGTLIGDLGTPSVWNAAVEEKYKFLPVTQRTKLIEPRRAYGEPFEVPERVYDIRETPSLFEKCGVPLSTYTYVLDETKRTPITRKTYIPKTGSILMVGGKTAGMEFYCPAYFLNMKSTPVYGIDKRVVQTIRAFRKPKAKPEKPFKWDLVETPEEDWF